MKTRKRRLSSARELTMQKLRRDRDVPSVIVDEFGIVLQHLLSLADAPDLSTLELEIAPDIMRDTLVLSLRIVDDQIVLDYDEQLAKIVKDTGKRFDALARQLGWGDFANLSADIVHRCQRLLTN